MKIDMLVKPIPYKDETPGSFMLRASEYNGWENLTKFLTAHNSITSNGFVEVLMKSQKLWLKFCNNTGLDIDALQPVYYKDMGLTKRQNVEFFEMETPWKDICLKEPKICIKCVEENKYITKLWDHKLINMCSKHNLEFIDECSKCQQALRWNRKGLGVCHCGESLGFGDLNEVDSTYVKQIESLIINKDNKSLNILCRFYDSFDFLFRLFELERSKLEISNLAVQAFNKEPQVYGLVLRLINKQITTYGIHPRLCLIPFLSSKESLIIEFGKHVLTLIDYEYNEIKNCYKFEDHVLSLSQIIVALGINKRLAIKLIRNGLIDAHRSGKQSKYFVKFLSVNELLNDLSIQMDQYRESKYKTINQTLMTPSANTDFTTLIDECVSGNRKFTSMDNNIGILSVKVDYKLISNKHKEFYSISDVAKLCDVNYENIRFAVKSGILKRVDSGLTKGTAIYIKKSDAKKFNEKYIFGGLLAKQYDENPTNFSEKIMSFGIEPVSGPGIDGGLTYLFNRDDIEKINIDDVKSVIKYPTLTGRNKLNEICSQSQGVNVSDAASSLGVSSQQIIALVKQGFLYLENIKSRGVKVTKESLNKTLEMTNDLNLISISESAKQLNEAENSFFWTWIKSGYIEYKNSGLDKYISKKDLQKVINFKSKYITSVEAAELAGHHRSYLPNLEKQGLIKHKKIFKNRKYSVKFYARKEVEQIIK